MPTPNTIPVEGTTLGYCTTSGGTYTTLGKEVFSITPPGMEISKVDTWGLGSTCKTSRPGKIPDLPELDVSLYADPNFADHATLLTHVKAGDILFWKLTYADGLTTHAKDVVPGFVTKFNPDEMSEENNLTWNFTIQPTDFSTFTPGVA